MIELVSLVDSYKYYRQEVDQEGIPTLDYKQGMKPYRKIVGDLIKFMMQKVFEGYDVKLGGKLGVIGIRGEKVEPIIVEKEDGTTEIRGVAPNFGETKKLWRDNPEAKEKRTIIYCFNEHTNGIKYRFMWSKKNVFITNKVYYSLTFSKGNRRMIPVLTRQGKSWLILDKKLDKDVKFATGEDKNED